MMIWIGRDIQHMRHDQISPIENVSVLACDMVTTTNAGTSTTPVGATMSHAIDNDCIIWKVISTKIYGITPWRVTWSHLREPHKR